MDRRRRIAFAVWLLQGVALAYGADSTVGSLKTLQGQVSILRAGQTLTAAEGLHLNEKDVLRTGADGRLGIILRDGTRVSLGPNSELTIDRFLFEPATGQLGLILRLARGVAAYVSGKISQLAPGSVQMQTPVG